METKFVMKPFERWHKFFYENNANKMRYYHNSKVLCCFLGHFFKSLFTPSQLDVEDFSFFPYSKFTPQI